MILHVYYYIKYADFTDFDNTIHISSRVCVCVCSVDKDELVKYTTVVDPNVNKEVYPLSKYVRAAIVFLTLIDVVKFNYR